ncbi:colicin immunity domain-containing protein [Citrobacter portucalensis]|uniref:Colicin immunity domain-containing protein n=1 Tax=Citrobacter portucalensis TaxID=1639133 RepID=A0A9X4JM45_9ENTR|nr:colicin immunity domain-containing protein [Citrobacter portucalensis]MDE9618616.1 colicin immunity domain-containing protein [Citrobacter portucalensis]
MTNASLWLIDSFLSGALSASEFDKHYSVAWRNYRDSDDINEIDENTKLYVDCVFTALDLYCSDPKLRDDNYLDDCALLSEVASLNKRWRGSD